MSDQICKILKQTFTVFHLEIRDESHKHYGHKGALETGGGHFYLLLVSDNFLNKPRVERHRMIYQALSPVKDKIHALGIQAYTVREYENSGA
ncbi:MAG: BolA family protein [Candidatus Omnitrophota bacterium]